jgi:hypothetical protein
VSIADAAGPDAVWVRFYLTKDAGILELNYHPATAVAAGQALATKLAKLLDYEFAPWDGTSFDAPAPSPDSVGDEGS